MLIETDPNIFARGDLLQPVLQIYRYLVEGRHEWAPTVEDVQAVADVFSAQVPPLGETFVDVAQKAWIKRAAWTPAERRSTALRIGIDNVGDAADDLGRPGIVVVEDLETDGTFVKTVVQVVGGPHANECLSRGWIELRHAGGGGRVREVSRVERARFKVAARVCAIIDSDSLEPGERTHAHTLSEQLCGEGVPTHVLAFREIENYLPNRAISSVRPYRTVGKKIGALKKMSEDQRAHFDMKKGFGPAATPGDTAPRHSNSLYCDLQNDVVQVLIEGFGPKVILCLMNVAASLTLDDLNSLGEGVVEELRQVVELIHETA